MSDGKPVIYFFQGDDEFAIQHALTELRVKNEAESGSLAGMNTTVLDGRTASLDDLRNATLVLPFISDRRLVLLHNPLARLSRPSRPEPEEDEPSKGGGGSSKDRQAFLELLEIVPQTTALVLAEYNLLNDENLTPPNSRKKIKDHWLVHWVKTNPERAYYRVFVMPRGPAMVRWIQSRAREQGGQIAPEAAEELSQLVGSDTRLAENELQKLLAYTNYKREIGYEDVALLTADTAQTSIFEMVDAMGARNGREAIRLLNRILEEDEHPRVFGMVVRQFRLLLLTRVVLEQGGGEADIARQVHVPFFVARKLNEQARRFTTPDLEVIYHRLLDIDRQVKTSQIEVPVALNTLVAATAA